MRTLIAIPCLDMIHSMFFKSILNMRVVGDVEFTLSVSSLVYDARNTLAKKAIDEGFDRVFWIDSDMTFGPDVFERLSARLDEGYRFVSGLAFKRRKPYDPVIYKECYSRQEENGGFIPTANSFKDYPKDSIFEIAACGFGAVMMETSVIKTVLEEYGMPFSPVLGFGEDLSFCIRADMSGIKRYCDSSIKFGHIGYKEITEDDFGM